MNERSKGFTITDAIVIQDAHLALWKIVLSRKVYQELYAAVKKSNEDVTDPYMITRGGDLDNWVGNYSNSYSPF